MNSTIKRADIFGLPIRLQINGEDYVRSILGGFITICLVVLIGVTFAIYSQDSFYKKNPQIISNIKNAGGPTDMPLNQTYFGFQISSVSQFDTATYFNIDTSGFKISDCEIDNPSFQTSPSYDGSILTNNWYCIQFINSTQTIIDFQFKFYYCRNRTNCKSRGEVNNYLGTQISINYIMLSSILNPNNYNQPVDQFMNYYTSWIRPNTAILNYLYYTPHELFTDDGLIYSNKYLSTFFPIFDDSTQEKTYPNSCDDNPLTCNILFGLYPRSSFKIITYDRLYKRISDALASVGGISNIFIKVFILFMNIYCTFIRNESIANYVYDFNSKDNNQIRNVKKNILIQINNNLNNENDDNKSSNIQISESSHKKPRIFPSINLHNRNLDSNEEKKIDPNSVIMLGKELPLPQKSPTNKMNLQEIKLIPLDKMIVKRNQKKYRFKFYDLLNYYVCCHFNKKSHVKRQHEIYKKVQKEMESLLDIKKILRQTEELDNLKMTLLNEEQYALLNFITKFDIIETLNEDDEKSKFNDDKILLNNDENLINIVNKLLTELKDDQNRNLDPLTSKLLSYIDINLLDNKI